MSEPVYVGRLSDDGSWLTKAPAPPRRTMRKRGVWVATLAVLVLMLLAACGGGGAGAARSSAAATSSPTPPPPEPPAFQGEPDYQTLPIVIPDDNGSTGLSDRGARDLFRWSVRFANYVWTFGAEGQTRAQAWRKAYPFCTPQLQRGYGPPARSDAEARQDYDGFIAVAESFTWTKDPKYDAKPLQAQFEVSRSANYPRGSVDIRIDESVLNLKPPW